jgi:phosphoenolpyruvate carboxykinase (GTP)
MDAMRSLRERLGGEQCGRIARIRNGGLHRFIAEFLDLCDPARVYVSADEPEDFIRIREAAIRNGEETRLAVEGHTLHFDNYADQGRDKKNTGILVPEGTDLGEGIETKPRGAAIDDIRGILRGIMRGKEAFVCFFCLGPAGSDFSIPCVQITDSSYVAHSETILYRPGYAEFVRQGEGARFFRFVHSQGALDERKTCRDLDRRRIYIDVEGDTVYSVNTQYGGNTIGLKKLAMRLAIRRGAAEGWLTEHMLIMGIHGPGGRKTFFLGAFPSLCGKTSTAMLEGETIVGDDIAYIRRAGGEMRAVNVEKGMFGIIQGVNAKDDPSQWKALHSPGEVIFSNVLAVPGGGVYWQGKDGPVPPGGVNHSGDWRPGKKDAAGKEIPPSHPNARFTLALESLDNVDPALHDPAGVPVGAIVYGGRDSDTSVPVEEAFDWAHGIVTKGAALESETTAATLGSEGVREFNPMSNLDFLSIPIGRYVQANLDFSRRLARVPRIFSVNYFLRGGDVKFLNKKTDKRVWYKWMELRVHDGVGALRSPTGLIPAYADLKRLFREVLGEKYAEEAYRAQFAVRVPENLAKIARIEAIYREKVKDAPPEIFSVLAGQRARLEEARARFGDYIPPEKW